MKNRRIKYKSGSLLPRINFWTGLGSVLNIGGSHFDYNHIKSASEIDTKALISDWNTIGDDIRLSRRKFERTNSKKYGLI